MQNFTSNSIEETRDIARKWLFSIAQSTNVGPSESSIESDNESTIVGMSGHLGAGKTAFVKCVAKELGIREEITSPTFVIMKIYEIPDAKSTTTSSGADSNQWPWKRMVHIDAYRLEKMSELEALKWEELVSNPYNLIMIEWPENVNLDPQYFSKGKFLKFEIKDGSYTMMVA